MLLKKGTFPLPSVSQIIAKAGVAKGTVYLYFASKEEIYLSLLSQYFAEFSDGFMKSLSASSCDDLVDNVSSQFLEFAQDKPKGVYLASIVTLILENNVSEEYLIQFKGSLIAFSTQIAELMSGIANSDKVDEFFNRFLVSYNQFLALWQHCNPPERVKIIMAENQLEQLLFDFEQEFKAQMQRTWVGLI